MRRQREVNVEPLRPLQQWEGQLLQLLHDVGGGDGKGGGGGKMGET